MKKINIKAVALKAAGTTAGAVAGAALNKIPFISTKDAKIRGIIKIAAGAFLPGVLKAKSGDMLDNAANGLMAIGGLELANSFIGGTDATKKLSIAGVGDLPALGNVGGADLSFDEDYRNGTGSSNEIDIT